MVKLKLNGKSIPGAHQLVLDADGNGKEEHAFLQGSWVLLKWRYDPKMKAVVISTERRDGKTAEPTSIVRVTGDGKLEYWVCKDRENPKPSSVFLPVPLKMNNDAVPHASGIVVAKR